MTVSSSPTESCSFSRVLGARLDAWAGTIDGSGFAAAVLMTSVHLWPVACLVTALMAISDGLPGAQAPESQRLAAALEAAHRHRPEWTHDARCRRVAAGGRHRCHQEWRSGDRAARGSSSIAAQGSHHDSRQLDGGSAAPGYQHSGRPEGATPDRLLGADPCLARRRRVRQRA